jgi:hypothetical protein
MDSGEKGGCELFGEVGVVGGVRRSRGGWFLMEVFFIKRS